MERIEEDDLLCARARKDLDCMTDHVASSLREQAEPDDYVALLAEAKRRVRASVLWKRFIEHTPLENDIAVWMADFASEREQAGRAEALREAEAVPELFSALKDAVQVARNYHALFHDEMWKERLTKWEAALRAAGQEPAPSPVQHHATCDPGFGPANYRCHPDCKVRAAGQE